ncbi:cadherin-like beta sandwich domain-containing protein [Paenibacillus terreus]|uniref:Cadherin-like beta sandwich domain-containing protein n=1 Tax=Paenibacillus terreus TaxID=1387834 RepID=A0ABV5BGL0_9BACL
MKPARYFITCFTAFLLFISVFPWHAQAATSDGNADISTIYQGAGALSPAFSPSVTEYSVRMRSTEPNYYFAVATANPDATIEYSMNGGNWTPLMYYTSSGYLATNRGDNTLLIRVTSTDLTTTKTYTLHIYFPETNDADLSDLQAEQATLSPDFDPSETSYTANVPYTVDSISLTAVLDDPAATLTINGAAATSGTPSSSIPLNVGATVIPIRTLAADSNTTKTYTATIWRDSPGTTAELSNLAVPGHTLSPTFAASTTAYSLADVGYADSTLTVIPTTADAFASVQVRVNGGAYTAVGSDPLNLNVGDNQIEILATAQDGNTSKLYTLSVRRKNNEASLSGLAVSPGGLNESFTRGVFHYTMEDVGNETDTLTVQATLSDTAGASARINVNGGAYTTVTSGSSLDVPLSTGSNTITVVVTAEDENYSSTYTLLVNRLQNSTVEPDSATFDKYVVNTDAGHYRDVAVTLTNNHTLVAITHAGTALAPDSYTLSGDTVIFHKEYLATLGIGYQVFTFEMDGEIDPVFTLQVTDTTPPSLEYVVAGDGHASLTWTPLDGATGYNIYQGTASGVYDSPIASVSGAVYNYDVTGLANGTTYYFAVQAVNPGGDSAFSNEISATPQVSAPDVPVLQEPVAGDAQVDLKWTAVEGANGYKIYQSLNSGSYDTEIATVTRSVYQYSATGLRNGTTYYFVVKAANPGGDSSASNEVSAMPKTVPAAPTDVIAVAGDRQATVSFTAPAENGGSAVTGYEVTASPGNLIATGTASPITVTGLSNGTAYTFTVKAVNSAGKSGASAASNEVIPQAPASGTDDRDGGSRGDRHNSSDSAIASPVADKPAGAAVDVLLNGSAHKWGWSTTAQVNGRQVTTISLDQAKLAENLAEAPSGVVLTIASDSTSEVFIGELSGQIIKRLQEKQAVLRFKSRNAVYTLPAGQIDINAFLGQFGQSVKPEDITVQVQIAALTADQQQIVDQAAASGNFELAAPALNFTVRAVYGDNRTEVSAFSKYVEQAIALPRDTDSASVATAVAINPDGSVYPVPARLEMGDENNYAVVSSLSSSIYAIVRHTAQFQDVAGHWARASVNEMAARMVVNGVGDGQYAPDQDITRAEFAAILVRGLGLKQESDGNSFSDVKASAWYSAAIETAAAHDLISGYADGSFHPLDNITREQAMVMLDRAMTLTGLAVPLKSAETPLASFTDAGKVSDWAYNSMANGIQAGIVSGRTAAELAPQAFMTRAEVAVIVQRLLEKSGLI